MDTLEDWLKETRLAAAETFKYKLKSLGISAETFTRDETSVAEMLCKESIPRVAAYDIVHCASSFFAERRARSAWPLAVFWDAENVRVPTSRRGQQVANAIKDRLSSNGFGRVSSLRVYLDMEVWPMAAETRSELHCCGCHIIDTPHLNRKEVADKMIIVDAMMFALQHHETGGTLCFITGDTDFAYVISQLRTLSKIRTVLIFDGQIRDVLKSSADKCLRWETDILDMDKDPRVATAQMPSITTGIVPPQQFRESPPARNSSSPPVNVADAGSSVAPTQLPSSVSVPRVSPITTEREGRQVVRF